MLFNQISNTSSLHIPSNMDKVNDYPTDVKEIEETKVLSTNQDVAYQPIDPEEERKVVRKLDMVILPLMAFVYFFQCMLQT